MRKHFVLIIVISLLLSMVAGCGVRAGSSPDITYNDNKSNKANNQNNLVNDSNIIQNTTEDNKNSENSNSKQQENVTVEDKDLGKDNESFEEESSILEKATNKNLIEAVKDSNPDQAIFETFRSSSWEVCGVKLPDHDQIISIEQYKQEMGEYAAKAIDYYFIFSSGPSVRFYNLLNQGVTGKYKVIHKTLYTYDENDKVYLMISIPENGVFCCTFCDDVVIYFSEVN